MIAEHISRQNHHFRENRMIVAATLCGAQKEVHVFIRICTLRKSANNLKILDFNLNLMYNNSNLLNGRLLILKYGKRHFR